MNEKRIPFENDVPKHKKKSKKRGQPRADHKHEYKTVLLHSYFDSVYNPGEKIESKRPTKVCMICGRVGDVDFTRFTYEEIPNMPYRIDRRVIRNEESLEKWYLNDFFDKFAHK